MKKQRPKKPGSRAQRDESFQIAKMYGSGTKTVQSHEIAHTWPRATHHRKRPTFMDYYVARYPCVRLLNSLEWNEFHDWMRSSEITYTWFGHNVVFQTKEDLIRVSLLFSMELLSDRHFSPVTHTKKILLSSAYYGKTEKTK